MKIFVSGSVLARYMEKAKISVAKLCLFLLGISLFTYAFIAQNKDQELSLKTKQETMKSVSLVNGIYKIDTAVIWSNRNKDALVLELDKEKLVEKNNQAGIPEFIRIFLDSISPDKKFNMADPGEKWFTGDIKDLIYTRLYNNKKDTTTALCDKQNLKDKEFAYFAIGKNIAVLSYYSGGVTLSQNTIMIKFKDKIVVDFWFNNYGTVFSKKTEIFSSLRRSGNC